MFKPILDPKQDDVKNIAFSGAISFGEGYTDPENRIFFGHPFSNAYLLSENQYWMGGIIDHKKIPKDWILNYVGYNQPLIKYNVKGKNGENIIKNILE